MCLKPAGVTKTASRQTETKSHGRVHYILKITIRTPVYVRWNQYGEMMPLSIFKYQNAPTESMSNMSKVTVAKLSHEKAPD